jgi:iron complex transport system ATP-binding protein
MADPLLSVRGLSVRRGDREVLADVSLDAPRGRVTAILGPNGAGKTSLLQAVAGLLPSRGKICVDGADASAMDRRERARALAYVPQRSALDAPLAVEAVVAHGRYAHNPRAALTAADRRAVADAMEATDVTELARRPYTELSGGEQRRVLLARALATGAPVVLLDEPTTSLDIAHALALHAVLARLATDGACVVAVLHDLVEAAAHTDRAVVLDGGRVAAAGDTATVLSPDAVSRVWGVEVTCEPRMSFRLPEGA